MRAPKEQEDYLLSYRNNEWNKYLDRNYNNFQEEKQQSKTVGEVMSVIAKEHDFYCRIIGQYHYRMQDSDEIRNPKIDNCTQAIMDSRYVDWHKDLKVSVGYSLKNEVTTKEALLNALKRGKNITNIYAYVKGKNEQYLVKTYLDRFSKEMNQAKTVKQAINILEKKQSFYQI